MKINFTNFDRNYSDSPKNVTSINRMLRIIGLTGLKLQRDKRNGYYFLYADNDIGNALLEGASYTGIYVYDITEYTYMDILNEIIDVLKS